MIINSTLKCHFGITKGLFFSLLSAKVKIISESQSKRLRKTKNFIIHQSSIINYSYLCRRNEEDSES